MGRGWGARRRARRRHLHNWPTGRFGGENMRTRLGAPLVAALVGLLGLAQYAAAGHCGADKYSCCPEPCCDAQCCFSSCQQQCKTCYKLVYDTVLEKRWKTCYQTVQETVMKPVCKTCYREECKTCYKPCYETCYKTVQETCTKPSYETCWKECNYTVCKSRRRAWCRFPAPSCSRF